MSIAATESDPAGRRAGISVKQARKSWNETVVAVGKEYSKLTFWERGRLHSPLLDPQNRMESCKQPSPHQRFGAGWIHTSGCLPQDGHEISFF